MDGSTSSSPVAAAASSAPGAAIRSSPSHFHLSEELDMKYLKAGWLLAMLAACPLAAHADDRAALKEIQSNYNQISKAFEAKKMDKLSGFLAPDFTAKQPGGTVMTRDQVLADFSRQRLSM